MKLIKRNYQTADKNFGISRDDNSLWTLYVPSVVTSDFSHLKYIKLLNEYFNNYKANFNSKKELLYNLENFQNNYNLKLLPLIYVNSVYVYNNCVIKYWENYKDWTIDTNLLLDKQNYNTLNQSFKTRKEAIKIINNIIKGKS